MNIIFVSDRLSSAQTWQPKPRHYVLGAMLLVAFTLVIALAGSFVLVRNYTVLPPALLKSLGLDIPLVSVQGEQHVNENLTLMAQRVGQLQAQLLRLNALGERLAKSAGLKPNEIRFDQDPGRGGSISSLPSRTMSIPELQKQIEQLTREVDLKADQLAILDTLQGSQRLKQQLVPSAAPVENSWHSSSFGWRIDPFSGSQSFHEGLDFTADVGTPIMAAAGGVVIAAEYHPHYGNMVDLDHGDGLVTRYAHCSKLLVKSGTVVKRGQKIAEVGTTGRSTGPHLHFEVRKNGAPQNPVKFLQGSTVQASR